MALILDSDGGDERVWVVARRMWMLMEDTWRLIERDAAITEALSLRVAVSFLSLFCWAIAGMKKKKKNVTLRNRGELIRRMNI